MREAGGEQRGRFGRAVLDERDGAGERASVSGAELFGEIGDLRRHEVRVNQGIGDRV